MPAEPDAVEIRVVACLVEKQRTTPDVYPLSLNSLRLACNQSTNRDPVVDYDEATVSDALRRTALRGWTRLTSGAGSRARKYRHLLDDALGVDSGELAVLAVLMLRGAQTPGELKGRTERLEGFADLSAVNEVLARLIERGFVIRHPRRPGQKEDRYEQVLGGADGQTSADEPPEARSTSVNQSAARSTSVSDDLTQVDRPAGELTQVDRGGGEEFVSVADLPSPSQAEGEIARLDRLEADLLELKGEIARLREALGD
ncbi:MAG TPA: YceH family protein [Solirubrobacterales bacterium]|nr:YceH family protein [Solirubrobacterales bacterium]